MKERGRSSDAKYAVLPYLVNDVGFNRPNEIQSGYGMTTCSIKTTHLRGIEYSDKLLHFVNISDYEYEPVYIFEIKGKIESDF